MCKWYKHKFKKNVTSVLLNLLEVCLNYDYYYKMINQRSGS